MRTADSLGSQCWLVICSLTICLAACNPEPPHISSPPRPVRFQEVEPLESTVTETFAGMLAPRVESSLSFRIDGLMTQRPASVGDRVRQGQLVASIDPEDAQNALRVAESDLAAVQANLSQAKMNESRQQVLLNRQYIAKSTYDEAVGRLAAATGQFQTALARLESARSNVQRTQLHAPHDGIIIAKGAEPGEVVRAGQMVLHLALDKELDAVVSAPPAAMLRSQLPEDLYVSLSTDERIGAKAVLREISPQADPATGAFSVRLALIDPPPQMWLGAIVNVRARTPLPQGIDVTWVRLPLQALTSSRGRPAVWVIDPATNTVSLRQVEVASSDAARFLVRDGLHIGERVVTAGVHALTPGQAVRLMLPKT